MSDGEAVAVAGQDHAHVLRALAVRDLRLLGVEVDRMAAELRHPGLERVARPGGLVEEQHEERLVREQSMRLPVLERGLELAGDRERLVDLLDRPVERLDEVASEKCRSVDR